jgi:UDPglucose 6-dehydrogenase
MKKNSIFCIGMWHLGCVTAGCMHKLGFPVTCFDFDGKVIDDLSKGVLPIYEKGLQELFTKEVVYTKDISDSKDHEFIFITYDINANGIRLEPLLNELVKVLKPYAKGKTIVVRSQVTLGACDKLARELECDVCYFPENLRLGTAVENFMRPDWVVLGISDPKMQQRMLQLFSGIVSPNWLFIGLREAEMVKMAMNCYLATLISLSGEISNICEVHDVDASTVMETLKLDRRVSKYAPIMPGLGFSGGTIERDLVAMRKLGQSNILDTVYFFNKQRGFYIKKRLESILGDLKEKTITFFGATYKTGTDTLRDSPVLKEIDILKDSNIRVYDPLVKKGIPQLIESVAEAKGSDAIVIMTDWDGWKKIDYDVLAPKVILDTKGTLPATIKHYEVGVKYV